MDLSVLVRIGLVLARPATLIMAAPVFGGAFAPNQVRIAIALTLAIILLPVVPVPSVVTLSGLVVILAREIAIGLAMAMSLRALMAGAELGGSITGSQLMLSYGSTIDPQGGVRSTLIASLYANIALLTFFAINGHHALLRGLTNSYQALPIGGGSIDDSLVRGVMQMLGVVFVFGLRLAAPIIIVMLIVEFGAALIARAAPAINLQVIGTPVRIVAGLLAVSAVVGLVPGLSAQFVRVATEAALQLARAFR
jgi:flagellar biosynthetic protein FliR